MIELFEQLYPQALACHVGPLEYWDLTLYEISNVIEAYNLEARRSAAVNYNLASMIALMVNSSLVGKEPPSFYDLYPDFATEETQSQNDLATEFYKEQFKMFAAGRNAQQKENAWT